MNISNINMDALTNKISLFKHCTTIRNIPWRSIGSNGYNEYDKFIEYQRNQDMKELLSLFNCIKHKYYVRTK